MSVAFNPIHANPGPVDGGLFNRVQDLIKQAFAVSAAGAPVTVTTPPAPGGAWAGFSATAPPAVTSASATGTSIYAARGDHTHALDLVAYTPSLVTMQTSGVLQQTYSAGVSTPSVYAMTAGNVVFGASTGLIGQNNAFTYVTATRRLFLQGNNAAPLVDATTIGQINILTDSATAAMVIQAHTSNTLVPLVRTYKSRGTQASPTAVSGNDPLIVYQGFGHDGVTGYVSAMSFGMGVPFGSTVGSGSVPTAFFASPGAGTTENLWTLFAHNGGDSGGGSPALTTTSTAGWWWVPATDGPPTVAPTFTYGGVVVRNRVPMQVDVTNDRAYFYVGGAWKYAQLI